jgi:hypothetical protein
MELDAVGRFPRMAELRDHGQVWGDLTVPIGLCVSHIILALAEYHVLNAILEVMRQQGNVLTSEEDAEARQGPIFLPTDR